MANVRYVTLTETAKLLRVALKKAFPKVKFSVRGKSYSGGASITVGWTDGPTAKMVDAVIEPFACGGFDGMIDMAYSKYSWLMPDGSATRAKIKGTIGSAGSVESEQYLQPSFKSELVRFGADYIFTSREFSLGFYSRAVEAVERRTGVHLPVKVSAWGTPMIEADRAIDGEYASNLVYRALSRRVGVEA